MCFFATEGKGGLVTRYIALYMVLMCSMWIQQPRSTTQIYANQVPYYILLMSHLIWLFKRLLFWYMKFTLNVANWRFLNTQAGPSKTIRHTPSVNYSSWLENHWTRTVDTSPMVISVAALFDQRATGCKKSALCFVQKIFFQVTPLTFWERNLPHGFQTSAENLRKRTQTTHQRINFSWVAKPQGAMRLCQFRLLRVYQVLQLPFNSKGSPVKKTTTSKKQQTSGQIAIIFHQPGGPGT